MFKRRCFCYENLRSQLPKDFEYKCNGAECRSYRENMQVLEKEHKDSPNIDE
ncbi:hypothetical protein [Alkalibacillus aidingensis]|uniref:hypothetical protein n=1 Tax=Alkalibacillus aidingensis TaxID=2747607 RepID=UPI0016612C78|nr:hypothetical protein [Alkalibacillus aidingensis]